MATYPGGIPSLPRPPGATQMDATGFKGSEVIDGISDEVEAIAGELGVNPSGGSATVVARLDALDTTVSGKAASSHTHTAANVTDFAESVRDTIGSALVAGTNVTITVNDGADTITIDAAGGGGLTEEQTEDIVNGLLVAGSNISLTYDDVANTLTIAVSGLEEVARDAIGTALTAGTGISVTPNDGADTITVATSAILPTVVDAKGDLIVGTAADTVARLAVGTNGHVLTADSAEASGVKWAAAGGGSGTTWTKSSSAPSGGSAGDYHQRTGSTGIGYRNESGTWEPSFFLDSVLANNSMLRGGIWTINQGGVVAALSAGGTAAADVFTQSQTGVTYSSGTVTASNSKAWGQVVGGRGLFAAFTVTTLPTSSNILYFGIGRNIIPSIVGYGYPTLHITSGGVATLKEATTTLKTFSGTVTGGSANHYFAFRLFAGSILVLQRNGTTGAIVDQALFSSADILSAGLGNGMDWWVQGYGTVSFQNLEVLA